MKPHKLNHYLDAKRRQNQAGLTLLETLLSLVIFAASIPLAIQLYDDYDRSHVLALAAEQHRTFAQATQGYIKDNYQPIAAELASSPIYKVSVTDLIGQNRLPANYTAQNAYKQNLCAVVRLVPGLTTDSLPQLQALVVAEGGKALDDISLGRMASQIGGSGGGVYARAPHKIEGSFGAWSIPSTTYSGLANQSSTNCSGQAGHVQIEPGHPVSALWFENGDVSTSFLSRDAVPGLPSLNTMQTPLVLGKGAEAIDGTPCAPIQKGALARDANGRLLSCQSPAMKWSQVSSIYWADPVEQATWLTGYGAVSGQVRLDQETGQLNYFNGSFGSGWSNLFVSPAGNLSMGTQGVNATGTDNAYFGIGSTPKNVTGAGNLHLGNGTGMKSAAAWGNTLVGNNVSPDSLGSTSNTMVGYNVGTMNRTTKGNTYTGAHAGAMNQDGNYNTLYGMGAGGQTVSSLNDFYGFNAGHTNRTGSGNAYFGAWSGRTNVSGSQNSFFGQYAGSNEGVNNAIAIGYGALVSASNAIQLGRNNLAYQVQIGGAGSTVTSTHFNGTVFAGSAFNVTSDRDLKTNIVDAPRGLDFINQLRPVEYGLTTDHGRKHQGFIAQEVEAIDPDFSAVKKPDEASDHYALNYIEFIPSLVKSVQELDRKLNRNDVKPVVSSLDHLSAWGIGLLALMCTLLSAALFTMRQSMKKMARQIEALQASQLSITQQRQSIAP